MPARICPSCGKAIGESEAYQICSVCRRNYHRSCGTCPAHPTAEMTLVSPTSPHRIIRRISPPAPVLRSSPTRAPNPAGFWGTLFVITIFGGGMGWLWSTGIFFFSGGGILGTFLLHSLFWSVAPTAYILTRRPSAAFFTQVLFTIIPPLAKGYFDGSSLVFSIFSGAILSIVINQLKHSTRLASVITATVCAGIATDIFAIVAWDWRPSFSEWIAGFLGSAFSAPVAIVFGRMFGRR